MATTTKVTGSSPVARSVEQAMEQLYDLGWSSLNVYRCDDDQLCRLNPRWRASAASPVKHIEAGGDTPLIAFRLLVGEAVKV